MMGQAKRRRERGERAGTAIKISPRKRVKGFRWAHYRRREVQQDNGVIVAINFFQPIDDDGNGMFEETPDGPRPVLVASIPQPVRRAMLVGPGLVTVS